MELNAWTKRLRAIHERAVSNYRDGDRRLDKWFSDAERQFLASIGLEPIHVYDAAEDYVGSGEPDWDTFLLIAAARRDYFLQVQREKPMENCAAPLPERGAQLGGIPWLPRIIRKARCFLEGSLREDIMYCCGGDRHFLRSHGIHPADFLRAVWASQGDDRRVLEFVKAEKARADQAAL